MLDSLLADVIAAFHVAFIAFTIVGQLVILIGVLRGAAWARNPWLRTLHLACILVVAVEYAVGIDCPLTTLEMYLRGEAEYTGAAQFMDRFLRAFVEADPQDPFMRRLYLSFTTLVIGTFVLAPPRWRTPPVATEATQEVVACPD